MNFDSQNLVCPCRSFTSFDSTPVDESFSRNTRRVVVDFGTVYTLKEYMRTLELPELKTKEETTFKIERDADVSPLYRVFRFTKYEGFIKSGETCKIKVIFHPILHFEESVDNFQFIDSSLNIIKIVTRGVTLGPAACISSKELTFYAKCPRKNFFKSMELRNTSKAPVYFNFIHDNSTFQVEPSSGTIPPCKYIYLKFTFSPEGIGIYAQQMNCLIWNNEPIAIYLTGLYTNENVSAESVKLNKHYFPFEHRVGYGAFMRDITNSKCVPVTLNRNTVNFGSITENAIMIRTKTESVTVMNHMRDEIEIVWPIEGSSIFSIKPKRCKISPSKTFRFECSFTPQKCFAAHNKFVTAQVHWKLQDMSVRTWNVPLNLDLTLQGVSYSQDDWIIRNIEISPEEIILAPCLPGMVVNHNFKIKNSGPVRLPYRIYPTKTTDIKMKPDLGVIKDSEIICMQLKTGPGIETYYHEVWNLELCGNPNSIIPINVRCLATLPRVVVSGNNIVDFGIGQPGIVYDKNVSVRNVSHLLIRINMVVENNDYIKIETPSCNLAAHEEVFIKMTYSSSACAPQETKVKCTLNAITKIDQWIGDSFHHEFIIKTKTVYSQLCADPNNVNFGEVRWGTIISTKFYIYNFGESAIEYTLKYLNRSHNFDKFQITPASGVLKPREKQKIHFEGRVETNGDNLTIVSYNNTLEMLQEQDEEGDEPISLVQIIYVCSYALLQVEQIVEHTFGALFSKEHFWNNYIKANALNDILKEVSEEKHKSLDLFLPECEVSDNQYYVTLLLGNVTKFDFDITLKRVKLCDCQTKESFVSINKTKKVYDCPHRKMLSLELSSTKLLAHGQTFLTVVVKYTIPGVTRVAYAIQLGDDRSIQLVFTITAIPDDSPKLSYYGDSFCMNLLPVYVGRLEGMLQLYWLYNNTRQILKYKIDDVPIQLMCQREGFKILELLNPSGEIESYSSKPLLVRFTPIQHTVYKVCTNADLAGDSTNFMITGQGLTSENKKLTHFVMPEGVLSIKDCPVICSMDYFEINPMRVWSTTEKMVFIKNVTKNKIIQFEWQRSEVPAVVRIKAEPEYGVLKPKESKTVLINVTSFNEIALVEMTISCLLVDYTQTYKHKSSISQYEMQLKKLEEEFVLENDHLNSSVPSIEIESKPEAITISISSKIFIISSKQCEAFISPPSKRLDLELCPAFVSKPRNGECVSTNAGYFSDTDGAKILLEQLISDCVFSPSFNGILKACAEQSQPYYHEIFPKRRLSSHPKESLDKPFLDIPSSQMQDLLSKPSLPLVYGTLKQIILDGTHNLFQLSSHTSGIIDVDRLDQESEKILHACSKYCSCKK